MSASRFVGGATLVSFIGIASAATGQSTGPEPYPSATFGGKRVLSDESPSTMQINCTPVAAGRSGRQRIECRFTQTMISLPPPKAEVDQEVARTEAEIRAGHTKNPAATWKDCGKVTSGLADRDKLIDDDRKEFDRYVKTMQDACARKDLQPLIDYVTEQVRRKERTCTLRPTNEFTETLERTDADTWVGTNGPRGTCNVTVTVTFWRTVDHGMAWWNFKQVRVTPESETGPDCRDRERVSVTTMRWNGRTDWAASCQYLKL